MHSRFLSIVGLGLPIALATPRAFAQNADPFAAGDEGALANGAVVASGRDAGMFWYNPAAFGGLSHGLVSASAATFGLRIRSVPRILRVRAGGNETAGDASSVDVISVPNAVVGAARLTDRLAVAAGLLVTERDVRSALVSVPPYATTDASGAGVSIAQRVDLQVDETKYHFGPALAATLGPNLRVGAAFYGTYGKQTRTAHYAVAVRSTPVADGSESAFVSENARITTSAFGAATSIGAQWRPAPRLSVGLTLRSPELAFAASSTGGVVDGIAAGGGTTPGTARLEERGAPDVAASGKVIAPGRALVGVALALGPPNSWLEFGFDASHGLPSTPVSDARRGVVNARVGARVTLGPSWIVGAGVATDRATVRDVPRLLARDQVNYYGISVGVTHRTPIALVENKDPEALVLVTTLALRASVGFGDARALALDLDRLGSVVDARSAVTFYDLMPYLGSSVAF